MVRFGWSHWDLGLANLISLAGQLGPRLLGVHLPVAGVRGTHTTPAFCGGGRDGTRVFMLVRQALYDSIPRQIIRLVVIRDIMGRAGFWGKWVLVSCQRAPPPFQEPQKDTTTLPPQ